MPSPTPPWITSGLNDAPADCTISIAAACASRLHAPVTKSSSRRGGRAAFRGRSEGEDGGRGGRGREPIGTATVGLPSIVGRRAVDHVPDLRLGLVIDPERQPQGPPRDLLGRLDQVAREVPLDPLAEEGVGDPDLQRIAVDARAGPPRRTRARTAPRPAARPPPPATSIPCLPGVPPWSVNLPRAPSSVKKGWRRTRSREARSVPTRNRPTGLVSPASEDMRSGRKVVKGSKGVTCGIWEG